MTSILRAAVAAWAVLIGFTLLGPALAETAARIAARLDIVVRSGTCPAPAIEIPITGSSDYCGLTDFSRDDNEYYMERERCRRELDPLQSAQHRYNAFIRKCQQIGQQKKAAEPTTTEHEKNQKRDAEAEEARKKSEKSRQEEAAMRALQAHRERRERVEQLAEEEAAKTAPITQLTHRVLFQVVCPQCKERQVATNTPPSCRISAKGTRTL